MKKYVFMMLCVLTMIVSLTSCQDDDDIYDRIVGNTWVGYLGFHDGPFDLESGIYFGSDGFGTDELYYYDGGDRYGKLNIQWELKGGDIYISYGKVAPPRELRGVYVRKGELNAALYVDGRYVEDVTLYRD